MDNLFLVGDIVKSLSGHDKNKLFLVVSIDKNGYLAIIDGRTRLKIKPKLKNPKHLERVAHDENILNKYNSPLTTNTEIYKLINKYNKELHV